MDYEDDDDDDDGDEDDYDYDGDEDDDDESRYFWIGDPFYFKQKMSFTFGCFFFERLFLPFSCRRSLLLLQREKSNQITALSSQGSNYYYEFQSRGQKSLCFVHFPLWNSRLLLLELQGGLNDVDGDGSSDYVGF